MQMTLAAQCLGKMLEQLQRAFGHPKRSFVVRRRSADRLQTSDALPLSAHYSPTFGDVPQSSC
jgi:hypothetical protein